MQKVRSFLFLHVPHRHLEPFRVETEESLVQGFILQPEEFFDKYQFLSTLPANSVPTPRCLPTYTRGNVVAGAHESCHPHQATLWPTTLYAAFDPSMPHSSVVKLISDAMQQHWSMTPPMQTGFRRAFGQGGFPYTFTGQYDHSGYPRVAGSNDLSEYGVNIPIEFAWPGWFSSYGPPKIDYIWSSVISTSIFAPTNAAEAAMLAKHLEQVMTSIGNLWFLDDIAQKVVLPISGGKQTRLAGFDSQRCAVLVLVNFVAIVECAGAIITKKRNKRIDIPNSVKKNLPVLGFAGENSEWIQIIRHFFETPGSPFNGFFVNHERELKTLAEAWNQVRHDDTHSPSPLITAHSDFTDVSTVIGVEEAKEISAYGYSLGRKIVELLDAFPISALSP
jgi:hypothetical protein